MSTDFLFQQASLFRLLLPYYCCYRPKQKLDRTYAYINTHTQIHAYTRTTFVYFVDPDFVWLLASSQYASDSSVSYHFLPFIEPNSNLASGSSSWIIKNWETGGKLKFAEDCDDLLWKMMCSQTWQSQWCWAVHVPAQLFDTSEYHIRKSLWNKETKVVKCYFKVINCGSSIWYMRWSRRGNQTERLLRPSKVY